MVTIGWCKRKRKGISLTEPNENLCHEYLESAGETLSVLRDIKSKSNMWLATTKYYCEYFAVYALLMKLGIKSEIHDCTIELCRFLEKKEILPKGTYERMLEDKKMRIDNQYYLKNKKVKMNFSELVDFVLEIKKFTNSLTREMINGIRKELFGKQ